VTADSFPSAPAGDRAAHRLVAFGLNVDCDWPLPRSVPATGPAPPPATRVRELAGEALDGAWRAPAERLFEPSYPDGRTRFTVDLAAGRYRLWFEGFGRYLVGADGSEIGCDASEGRERRERFLFAQALPLASVLRGFQPLHASAVCGDSGVAAFLGASGAGKTSLASRLVLRGAGFVTDDVLALESGPDAPLAHPGPPFMAVPDADRELLGTHSRLGAAVGASDKLHASPAPPGRPLPLRVVFHLERGGELELAPLIGGDAERLLATAFAPYLMTSERLLRHLQIAEQISATVAQFRLQVPRTGEFGRVLEAVEATLREVAV
jgi:hypothetical protein